ncbi:fumarylacetoacetate hydrolase family protein [Halalkalibacter krulwichiae]|uniref:Ureidoglycolate lyase n=1 Tax=Halalkalibacter krulwichiae TaxID=199441 RepID=A0A1X9M9V7_9BACI|nr:fumarylacetoacetate hydrolase family protein [Halalkalibacter krulwichiae]ARK30186.1 Ureidoglycolate lyase [Halalkalibacter krulwichiae]
MRTVAFYKEDKPVLGVKTSEGILDVEMAACKYSEIKGVPLSVTELIAFGEKGIKALETLVQKALASKDELIKEKDLSFAPCVPDPEKIICVGLNYKKHADECKMDYPPTPILFSKFSNALSGHNAFVTLPSNGSEFDYEAELVLVIGKEAKDVTKQDALSYLYGYCNGNDLSVRDLQFTSSQWLLGKTTDEFCPIGPYLVSKDEVSDPDQLSIKLTLNGELRQNSNTSDMIFNCSEIISYISQHMTLKPGDIILTGTPEGVIMGEPIDRRVWLKSGDEVKVEIEGLGELTTTFK